MKRLKRYSQRTVFTVFMTILATLFGGLLAVFELHWQSDVVFDVIKIVSVIALGTVFVSYACWTLTHMRRDNLKRGGVAGMLTALVIIPLPNFSSEFKTGFLANYKVDDAGVFGSAIEAFFPAMETGLGTFLILTKVSLVAVISSIILGIIIAKIIPPRPDEI